MSLTTKSILFSSAELHEGERQHLQLKLKKLNETLRQTQFELTDANNRYAEFYDHAPVGFLTLDHLGVIDEINLTAAALFGEARIYLRQQHFSRFIAEESLDHWQRYFREIIEHDSIQACKLSLLHKGGKHFHAQLDALRLCKTDGEPVVRIVITDIIARKRTKQSLERKQTALHLRESEAQYRALFQTMLNGFAYCRMLYENGIPRDFIYLDVNASFETQTGLKNVRGKRVSEVIPGICETDPQIIERYGRVALGGQPEQFETYVEALGMWFIVSVYSPKPEHFVSVFDVITERKQAEKNLRQMNEELELRVAERTSQLEASNRELEAFAYSVSHDLRAPLRSIEGFVELLRKSNYDSITDKGQHYMDVIADSSMQMEHLIDAILTFSRIGRTEMCRSRVNLNQLLLEVRNTLRPQIEGRKIEWKISSLNEVNGERTMLSLVLTNLISNALKFTRTREIAIIEIGQFVSADNESVCFVKDNGAGFDMRYADKLFGLFQRLHPQEQFEGTGVGLANVQRIIQRHGGRVWAEGKVNEGATFYFALPKQGE